ncbi:hypothetical protein HBB16_07600 [Pseudonocardia sp. MCCB 268]|nr:hypothetical protein [Pseudonocardia cytotoxica]
MLLHLQRELRRRLGQALMTGHIDLLALLYGAGPIRQSRLPSGPRQTIVLIGTVPASPTARPSTRELESLGLLLPSSVRTRAGRSTPRSSACRSRRRSSGEGSSRRRRWAARYRRDWARPVLRPRRRGPAGRWDRYPEIRHLVDRRSPDHVAVLVGPAAPLEPAIVVRELFLETIFEQFAREHGLARLHDGLPGAPT